MPAVKSTAPGAKRVRASMTAIHKAPEIGYREADDLILYERKQRHRLLCAGDRNWADKELIRNVLLRFDREKGIDYLIHGNNGYNALGISLDQDETNASDIRAEKGADKLCGAVAVEWGIPVMRFPPLWDVYGRRAGIVRNEQMILQGQPTYALLFHDTIESSRGTGNMKKLLEQYHIPYEIVRHE